MARLPLIDTDTINDPEILGIFAWVTEMEGIVPNHFALELNDPALMKHKLGFTKALWENCELSMNEIQHVGIIVSKGNGCAYCTGAFCTILADGLGAGAAYAKALVAQGAVAASDQRTQTLMQFADKVNVTPEAITDADVEGLKSIGLSNKGVIQVIHLVSDFASYNRLNLALDTDYDYASFGPL